MNRYFNTDDWTAHPALRVLALAWVVAAAQSPDAAWAWSACLAIGLIASQWRMPAAEADAPPVALRELQATVPARRRTDSAAPHSIAKLKPKLPLLNAHQDSLPGLSTPEQLNDTREPWEQDLRARDLSLCVLYVGLDSFEPVTERYGQEAGDHVLTQIAKRLRHLARDEDRVMRLQGQEFALLLSCPSGEAVAFSRTMAARVAHEVRRPLGYRTVSNLHIGCSVGTAIWPQSSDTLEGVMRHAEESLASARSRQAPQPQDACA